MKILITIFGICVISTGAIAAQGSCPDRFEEVPMENMLLTDAESCPTGTMVYYEINPICSAHVY